MNQTACIGFCTKIKNAPMQQPMIAPTMGIREVREIITLTSGIKGMRKIAIKIANKLPRITASRH